MKYKLEILRGVHDSNMVEQVANALKDKQTVFMEAVGDKPTKENLTSWMNYISKAEVPEQKHIDLLTQQKK